MLKKITVGISALALMGFATSAMAQTNPWAPGQTTVPITVTVQPMVELMTDTTPVGLEIVDAELNQGSTKAVERIVRRISNIDVDVSVSIDSDIPDNTQFFILVNPDASWGTVAASNAETVISWRRDNGNYVSGATAAGPAQVPVMGPNQEAVAFSRLANTGCNVGMACAEETVQYFADAGNFMPAEGPTNFQVLWTIASQ